MNTLLRESWWDCSWNRHSSGFRNLNGCGQDWCSILENGIFLMGCFSYWRLCRCFFWVCRTMVYGLLMSLGKRKLEGKWPSRVTGQFPPWIRNPFSKNPSLSNGDWRSGAARLFTVVRQAVGGERVCLLLTSRGEGASGKRQGISNSFTLERGSDPFLSKSVTHLRSYLSSAEKKVTFIV